MEKCTKDMSLLLKQAIFQCKSVTALACLTLFTHTRHTLSFPHLYIFFYILTPEVKVNMMQLTRKRIKKIRASYTLEGTNLENVESIKYLGVTITSDLRWNTHVSNVCTKANRTLGFLRRNLYSCPQEVKEAAYKGLVRPVLDYGSSVWDPPRCSSPGRIRKRAKARCQICDR